MPVILFLGSIQKVKVSRDRILSALKVAALFNRFLANSITSSRHTGKFIRRSCGGMKIPD